VDTTRAGSNAHKSRTKCRTCGWVIIQDVNRQPIYDVDECLHAVTTRQGSTKDVARTWCVQCCSYIDAVPPHVRDERNRLKNEMDRASLSSLAGADVALRRTSTVISREQLPHVAERFRETLLTLLQNDVKFVSLEEHVIISMLHDVIDDVCDVARLALPVAHAPSAMVATLASTNLFGEDEDAVCALVDARPLTDVSDTDSCGEHQRKAPAREQAAAHAARIRYDGNHDRITVMRDLADARECTRLEIIKFATLKRKYDALATMTQELAQSTEKDGSDPARALTSER
jgi:hypothetical protein